MSLLSISTFRLASPWFLLGFSLVVGLACFLWLRRHQQLDPVLRFPAGRMLDDVPQTFWARLLWVPDLLRIAAIALFVIGLSRPQIMGIPRSAETEGIDIVIALDTSGSMAAADFVPEDRMFVAKQSIAKLIEQRAQDRIGLVVFAAEAATIVPLTLDYALLLGLIKTVEVGMIRDGSAIGSAIGTALNRLRESDASSRVVLLLTDGANNAGTISPKEAALFAQHLDVKVYTILIGQGGAVPFPVGKDVFDQTIYKKKNVPTDPALLRTIARQTGGRAYRAKDGEELEQKLASVLDTLERTRIKSAPPTLPELELFPFFVWAGMLLLLLELLLRATRLARFP